MKITDILDALGLALLAIAGFIVSTPIGCAVAGGSCLLVSRALARKPRS